MVASSDPDAAQRRQWRYERALDQYRNGGSEEQLRAGLYAAGYYGTTLDNEVIYQRCIRATANKEKPADGFVSGLADKEW